MNDVSVCRSAEEWDEYVLAQGGHPLQLWGWGELKAAHGWRAERLWLEKDQAVIGAAQILVRSLPGPLRALVYVPRGPVVPIEADRKGALEAVAHYAKSKFSALAVTVEPDWTEPTGLQGWQHSANTILIPNTLILDLYKDESELLADMTKKTRQYIRKSAKEDVEIRQIKNREELTACLDIYHQTAARAGFAIHGDDYYYDVFDKLGQHSPVMAAFHQGEVVAFLWLAISQATAFELYGGVNDVGQDLRVNYALKWETIRLMKKWGVACYDMNGLLNDGVSNFKRGFASHEDILVGTYDKPLSPLYPMWHKGLPTAKKIIRKIKNR